MARTRLSGNRDRSPPPDEPRTDGHATARDIAAAEKINTSCVSRILQLTLPAPDIVEMILDGRQPGGLTMATLMKPFLVEWERQREAFLEAKWASLDPKTRHRVLNCELAPA